MFHTNVISESEPIVIIKTPPNDRSRSLLLRIFQKKQKKIRNDFDDDFFGGLKRVFVRDDGVKVFLTMVYEYTNGQLVEVTHGVDFGNVEEVCIYSRNYINQYFIN